ncbi:hypothetical protein TNCV_3172841 [Trichonephila clavipes]|nr:hypothetical protein TNCV_3172841 [Trichonephila clavipes]
MPHPNDYTLVLQNKYFSSGFGNLSFYVLKKIPKEQLAEDSKVKKTTPCEVFLSKNFMSRDLSSTSAGA